MGERGGVGVIVMKAAPGEGSEEVGSQKAFPAGGKKQPIYAEECR